VSPLVAAQARVRIPARVPHALENRDDDVIAAIKSAGLTSARVRYRGRGLGYAAKWPTRDDGLLIPCSRNQAPLHAGSLKRRAMLVRLAASKASAAITRLQQECRPRCTCASLAVQRLDFPGDHQRTAAAQSRNGAPPTPVRRHIWCCARDGLQVPEPVSQGGSVSTWQG